MDCQPNPDCKYFDSGCRKDTHHLYYPSSEYHTYIAHRFRCLPDNIVSICRAEHEQIHRTQDPPERPSDEYMAGFLLANTDKLSTSAIKRIRRELRG